MHSVLHGPDLPHSWIPQGQPYQVAQTQQVWYSAPSGSEPNSAGENTNQRIRPRGSLP